MPSPNKVLIGVNVKDADTLEKVSGASVEFLLYDTTGSPYGASGTTDEDYGVYQNIFSFGLDVPSAYLSITITKEDYLPYTRVITLTSEWVGGTKTLREVGEIDEYWLYSCYFTIELTPVGAIHFLDIGDGEINDL